MAEKDELVMVDFRGFVAEESDGKWRASLQITVGKHLYDVEVKDLFTSRDSAVDYLEKNSERITEVFCEKLGMVPQPGSGYKAPKSLH